MGQKVLLLGASGQLGELVKRYVPEGTSLICLSSTQLDITNREHVTRSIAEYKPDLIINTAAYTQVDKAEEEVALAYAINAEGPKNLAQSISSNCHIIHISTDFVFDGEANVPYVPLDQTNPMNIYGKSKLAGEQALQEYAPENTTIVRTAWLYSKHGSNFVNTMLQLMASKEELSVVNDQRGTPSSAGVLAKVIWKFAELGAKGVFHWTDQNESKEGVSWYEFACAIQAEALRCGVLGREIPIHPILSSEYPTPAVRPSYSVLDKVKTYQTIGIKGQAWQIELKNVLLGTG